MLVLPPVSERKGPVDAQVKKIEETSTGDESALSARLLPGAETLPLPSPVLKSAMDALSASRVSRQTWLFLASGRFSTKIAPPVSMQFAPPP